MSLTKRKVSEFGQDQVTDVVEPVGDLWLRWRQILQKFSGAILSFLVHSLLLVALTFLIYSQPHDTTLGIVAELTAVPDTIKENPIDAQLVIELTTDAPENSLVEAEAIDNAISDDIVLPTIADSDDVESTDDLAPVEADVPVAPNQPSVIGGGLEGRKSGSRSSLASKNGGTAASELAVENGLKWLVNHQQSDGSWRLDFSKGPCNGRCNNPATRESTTAATGLSLMAFLGAGYTHKSGPYQVEVKNGLDYLISRMRKSYFGGNLAEGTMYAQGIATIALSEAYSMTRDAELLEYVNSAMEYIVTAQHSAGGWRYTPGEPGDITVTGWQLMALKSCQLAGIEVPTATINKAKRFLASVGDESTGTFGYQNKQEDPTSTAIGLLLHIYLGWGREHRGLTEGSNRLALAGPSPDNIYFDYYATQVLFHARHAKWDSWNQKMRDYLIQSQSQTGHESGSWFFKERYGNVGGRLYTTAMAVMILEVYYRYLPLFDTETVFSKR